MDLLIGNLKRLNEDEESDRQGVFHILGEIHWISTFLFRKTHRMKDFSRTSLVSILLSLQTWF